MALGMALHIRSWNRWMGVVPEPTNMNHASPVCMMQTQQQHITKRFKMKTDMPSSPLSPDVKTGTVTERVRLECSFTAICAVLQAVLGARVAKGDKLEKQAAYARENGDFDVDEAALACPKPQLSVEGLERAYYGAQFAAALCPPAECAFRSAGVPRISIHEYIARLLSFNGSFSNAVYILMIALLDKAMLYEPHLFVHGANAHRLILAAFVVAAKSHEDCYVPNREFAYIGLVSVDEVNVLEVAFLKALDWRCHVSKERFEEVEQSVVREALGTPEWLSVLETLRSEQSMGWEGVEVPISPISAKCDNTPVSRFGVGGVERACGGMMAGISFALARFNYPQVPLLPENEAEALLLDEMTSRYSAQSCKRLFVLRMLASGMEMSGTVVPRMFGIGEGVGRKSTTRVDVWGNEGVPIAAVEFVLSDVDPFEGIEFNDERHEVFVCPPVVATMGHAEECYRDVAIFDYVFRGIDRFDFSWPSCR